MPRERSEHARHWLLDPEIDFLNHGSFGACPREVLAEQQSLRDRLERQPVQFFVRDLEGLLDAARGRLADFIGARADDLVPVPNATTAVNCVVRALGLQPGDELLTHDHAYGACRNALEHAAARHGGTVVVARIPFPIRSAEEAIEALVSRVTPRTRLALIDHVTSPTALVMPVGRAVAELEGRGVDVLVDGAHGPGMLDVNVERIGAAWYTGNCHKWPCAPKGAAFLHVRRDRAEGLHPLTISHGYSSRRPGRSRLHDEFDWTGTADPTPFLSIPAALDFLGALVPGGWTGLRERNRRLALTARDLLCDALGIEPPCPDEMIGSMAAVPLPPGEVREPAAWAMAPDPLQDALLERHGIEVPVTPWPRAPARVLRVSAQAYNDETQFGRLADALRELPHA